MQLWYNSTTKTGESPKHTEEGGTLLRMPQFMQWLCQFHRRISTANLFTRKEVICWLFAFLNERVLVVLPTWMMSFGRTRNVSHIQTRRFYYFVQFTSMSSRTCQSMKRRIQGQGEDIFLKHNKKWMRKQILEKLLKDSLTALWTFQIMKIFCRQDFLGITKRMGR